MIHINNPKNCCGCTACVSICNQNAITMQPDTMGFLYPKVDNNKCIECGLCERVCNFNEHYNTKDNFPFPKAYAVRHKNNQEIETSRSGAAFIAISDWVINQGGVVYGVGFTSQFNIVHKRATTKAERDEFKGSKYVQSNLKDTFRQIKNDLKQGLYVLFSGTPCQTAGLNAYINNNLLKDHLILVDIICHGVSSPKIWQDYLHFIENKEKASIIEVNFRNKKYGWSSHIETFKFNNGEIHPYTTFTKLFYQHIIFRHSCEICHFCNMRRPSDITLGDFWGWEKTNKNINADNKGISLVLCNTKKGEALFNAINKDLNIIPAHLKDCMQTNLKHPSIIHPLRNYFEKKYQQYGFDYILDIYGNSHNFHKYFFYSASFILRSLRYIYRKIHKRI